MVKRRVPNIKLKDLKFKGYTASVIIPCRLRYVLTMSDCYDEFAKDIYEIKIPYRITEKFELKISFMEYSYKQIYSDLCYIRGNTPYTYHFNSERWSDSEFLPACRGTLRRPYISNDIELEMFLERAVRAYETWTIGEIDRYVPFHVKDRIQNYILKNPSNKKPAFWERKKIEV